VPVLAPYRRNLYERIRLRMNCKQVNVPVPDLWLR